MKYTIVEERRSCRPTIQLSLGVSGKTLPNMTNMLQVLMVATNLVVFSQCLTATQISEHFLLLQAMAWPSKCQSMTQTMSWKCEVGIKWGICWGSFLSWSRTCWHIFDVCGLETVIFKHLAKTTWFVSISFTFKDLFPQKENISNVSLKRLLDLVFLYLMGSMYGIFTYTFTIKSTKCR